MTTTPQPGEHYERDGQERLVTSTDNGIVKCFIAIGGKMIGRGVFALETWNEWSATARKVESGKGE